MFWPPRFLSGNCIALGPGRTASRVPFQEVAGLGGKNRAEASTAPPYGIPRNEMTFPCTPRTFPNCVSAPAPWAGLACSAAKLRWFIALHPAAPVNPARKLRRSTLLLIVFRSSSVFELELRVSDQRPPIIDGRAIK